MNAYESYRQIDTVTASPAVLTGMLFDGALKAIRRARLFAVPGSGQKFYDQTQKAHLILGELLATLDMDQGELPRGLAAIYSYCLQRLALASIENPAPLDEVERHVARIGEAWKSATMQLAADVAANGQADAVA